MLISVDKKLKNTDNINKMILLFVNAFIDFSFLSTTILQKELQK
ncbi:hypothetical protein E0F51_06225 [Streptococcus pyogenes]|uniref:Uncharacterized protein n=4 Tax=Streptococcus pyogenes TaxID=1314 RepID=Q99XT7_STRP1|nr:hypothetical protein SPy_2041 [Streptococcus pyogenes M1 GAS]AAL98561.1 hypothetical protein spyM18_2102 [Streptococcus pyogenes MGAS8232]AAT87872.1 Hypothetical protein M6_Spy1737 [Streptococcus pyogenes MGAS10394]AAX72833.1 hypothetical protein M28_Spy1723 [Streptococcus pyogenes MGAS6180]AAZ52354.1 hypothetical protein M5005_Spy1736 [Streptococcus pyogenes MGAS5005]ABF32932.1 hypothetical protein MGAS9429_Spy1745 [Streptococcus pyogenes MGAS9429]ABF34870.1 hypothetical protein MGAS10270